MTITITSIGDVLKKIIQEKKWEDRFKVTSVWSYWDEVVGAVVAQQAQPQGFKQGCLWIAVSDPMWMHHLQISKEVIRQNLNEKIGSALIKSIRFTLAPSSRKEPAFPECTRHNDRE